MASGIALWSAATAWSGLVVSYWAMFIGRLGIGTGETVVGPGSPVDDVVASLRTGGTGARNGAPRCGATSARPSISMRGSARARQCPTRQNRHGIGLSGCPGLGPRRHPARRRRKGPHSTRMTRGTAARAWRGTINWPTETRKTPATTRALRRHPPPRLTPTSLQNYLTRREIHQ